MRLQLGALCLIPSLLTAQSSEALKHAPHSTTAAITAEDLRTRLYIFADDSMMGRETGTRGHLISTDYIAREVRRLGLQPAGDSGTFFQTVPLLNRPFDSTKSIITVDGTTLTPGVDFVPQQFRGAPRAFDGAQVIFGGAFGDTTNLPPADSLRGSIVVFTSGRGGFAPPAFTNLVSSAALLVRAAGASLQRNAMRNATWPTANMLMKSGSQTEVPLTLLVTQGAAETLLGAPIASATAGARGKTVHGSIVFAESTAPARNVVAILRGSDPKLRTTYVAMGAHSDHIGILPGEAIDHDSLHLYNQARFAIVGLVPRGVPQTPEQRVRVDSIRIDYDSAHRARPARRDSVRNGADDDGSGSVTLLEIAEAFARSKAKPKRSIVFVWHTGEEKGLLGSRWYVDHPTVPRDSIVAQLNMDMVGRGEKQDIAVGAPNYLELVGSRRLSSELGDVVEDVNRRQLQPFAFDYSFDAPGHPENIYCRSDHYHYARWGIPVVFFTTGLHGDYHQVTDEPQYIAYEHMARVGRLVHDVATRVANMDHRPLVDGQKMDPNGVCRQ